MTLTTYKNIDAAIVCSHILADPSCVKHAFRTPPTDSSDSGWQFLCDKKSHSGKDAKVISADELVHLIPSGASILETPPQCAFVFERNCWHRRQYPYSP
jgi:hypothetical protein